MALITAHQELWRTAVSNTQAAPHPRATSTSVGRNWLHDASGFSPATQSLNAFIEDTQKYVSGAIRMVLHGGRAVDRPSLRQLAVRLQPATHDSGDSFDQKSSNGFIDI